VVVPERLELPTSAFEAHCSIQLSYGSTPLLQSIPSSVSFAGSPRQVRRHIDNRRTIQAGLASLLGALGPQPGALSLCHLRDHAFRTLLFRVRLLPRL
jgi:hypothetical protein